MCNDDSARRDASESTERRILHDLGYFGHYLFVRRGGRGGKQHVLKTLLKSGGHMTQRDLLELTSTTSAALSEVVGKLEREGLVTRQRCERDRRQLEVSLTPEGERRAAAVRLSKEEFEHEAFSCLSDDEKAQLLDMADRIYDHWNELEESERGESACNKN